MNQTEKDKSSFLTPVPERSGGMMEVAQSREAQEVQASMVIAKKFPRDEIVCQQRIKTACQRMQLAELAMYSYPRGGQTVTGPSIRLAEVLATSWGNIDFKISELEQKDGESVMMAVAWDLETNARSSRVFVVPHERKANGQIKKLDDPRDIYEMTANQGARRLRACILAIIPIDVQEAAIAECEKTLKGDGKEPLKDRSARMVIAFKEEFNVPQESIEKRLGHRIDVISEQELVNLRKIFTSLRDNFAKRDDYFPDMANPVESAKPKQPSRENQAPAGGTTQGPTGATSNAPTTGAGESEKKTEAPPEGKDVLYDPEKPIDSLAAMMRRDSVNDFQVSTYAKSLGLASKSVSKASEIREANIKKLCETWALHLDKIKALPAQ